jgi:hypothetical protein
MEVRAQLKEKNGPRRTEEEAEALADRIWERIASANHWGDGRTDAYRSLVKALRAPDGDPLKCEICDDRSCG